MNQGNPNQNVPNMSNAEQACIKANTILNHKLEGLNSNILAINEKLDSAAKKEEEDIIKANILIKNKIDGLTSTIFTLNAKLDYYSKYNIPKYLRKIVIKEQESKMLRLHQKMKQRAEVREGSLINGPNLEKLKENMAALEALIIIQRNLSTFRDESFNAEYRNVETKFIQNRQKNKIFKYVDWIDGDVAKYKGQPIYGSLHTQATTNVGNLFTRNAEQFNKNACVEIVVEYTAKKKELMKQYIDDLQNKMATAIQKFKADLYTDILNNKKLEIDAKIQALLSSNDDAARDIKEIGPMNRSITEFAADFDACIEKLTPTIYMKEFTHEHKLIHYIDPITFNKSTDDVSGYGINTSAQSISIGKRIYFIGGDLVPTTLYIENKSKVLCNDMHAAKYSHGLASWEGIIYSVGGFQNFVPKNGADVNNQFFIKDVECFNTNDNAWTKRTGLQVGRRSMAVFITRAKYLYAVSGAMENVPANHLVERHQISSPNNPWEFVEIRNAAILCRCFLSGFITSNNTVIIIGGSLRGGSYKIDLDNRVCTSDSSVVGCSNHDTSSPIISDNAVFLQLNSTLYQYTHQENAGQVPPVNVINYPALNWLEHGIRKQWAAKLELYPKSLDQSILNLSSQYY